MPGGERCDLLGHAHAATTSMKAMVMSGVKFQVVLVKPTGNCSNPLAYFSTTNQGKTKLTYSGQIKMFNHDKGFGFISRPDADDVFVHISNVEEGFTPQNRDAVRFDIRPGRKGDEAYNVQFDR